MLPPPDDGVDTGNKGTSVWIAYASVAKSCIVNLSAEIAKRAFQLRTAGGCRATPLFG